MKTLEPTHGWQIRDEDWDADVATRWRVRPSFDGFEYLAVVLESPIGLPGRTRVYGAQASGPIGEHIVRDFDGHLDPVVALERLGVVARK